MSKQVIAYFNNDYMKNILICSGVSISEFMNFVDGLERIIIVKGDCIGDTAYNKFEVFESRKSILKYFKEDQKILGDFCFMDYSDLENPRKLNSMEMGYMLYCAHMFNIRNKKVINSLDNHFVCMTHDDGFYMKIFYDSEEMIFSLIEKKILKIYKEEFNIYLESITHDIKQRLMDFYNEGILILKSRKYYHSLEIYKIGIVDDMDMIYNHTEKLKEESQSKYILRYKKNEWELL